MKVCAKGTKTIQAQKQHSCISKTLTFLKKERQNERCATGTKTLQAQNSKVATQKLQRYLTGVQRAGPLGFLLGRGI